VSDATMTISISRWNELATQVLELMRVLKQVQDERDRLTKDIKLAMTVVRAARHMRGHPAVWHTDDAYGALEELDTALRAAQVGMSNASLEVKK
jgi:hypothetical protein